MCLMSFSMIKGITKMEINQTNHYKRKRYKREKLIKKYLGGDGNVVDSFVVDKGHKNGLEKHCITDNGIIIIYNVLSGKLISKLVARPQQVKRYYEHTGKYPPLEYESILELAREHQILGYNKIW